jgi:spore germination protein YaaH
MEKTAYKSPWAPVGDKINLTWDYMSAAKKDMSAYVAIPGLNVISPTWFSLSDTEGNIHNIASKVYVEWAHSQGLQVWALCSNGFDPDLTQPFLRSYELRKKFIQQLLVFADTYGFDGINLDFENIYLADKDYLTQFVREMVPYMHEQGLTVSMDVTIRSLSENWSMVYDRVALSEAMDYMAVMTYDEHWELTKDPGSVASLPWVESGVTRILEQIPKEKLLLGIPFYTRLWKLETAADGKVTISTQTLSMPIAQKWLVNRGIQTVLDEESGQNYGEYTNGNITQKIWMEDEYSIRERVKLAREFELAGVASWRKGFETPDIWTAIEEELTKMP